MTCIVGVVHQGRVYLGGDSCAGSTDQYRTEIVREPKVFRLVVGECDAPGAILGYTTSFRMGQLLRWHLRLPAFENLDSMEWLVCRVVPEIRTVLKDHGFSTVEKNVETGGQFLFGVRGELFVVHGDFSVLQPAASYAAIGCGMNYSLGSLHTSAQTLDHPERRIGHALAAAAEYSAYVRGPWTIGHVEA